MSDTYLISDTHWGHSNIIFYSKRPYSSVEEMNESLILNWNQLVKPEDTVWHLGDFAFMKFPELKSLIWRLNGKKNLVLGNHDKMIIENRNELSKGAFESIQNYAEIKINGKLIVLFHYGMRVWNKSHAGSIMAYGHSHGSLPPFGKSVDVGVDSKEITSEYRPIHTDELIKYMDKRQGEVVDHHGRKDQK